MSVESFSTDVVVAEDAPLRDWWRLLKPRVMSLVVFTALVGVVAAPGGMHPVLALAAVLCIAVGGGASGALNQWYDADIDAAMKRTADRPVPAGRIAPGEALGFGLGLSLLSVLTLAVVANPLAAALLAFTIFFYAVVYTMWLKRSTPQNIVIGGLAGAMPPLVGWAAATGEIALAPALMVLVIFLWTPPHFWALSLWIEDDYRAAKVPMMSIVRGDRVTRDGIVWYTLATTLVAMALAVSDAGGVATGVAAVGLSAWFAFCGFGVRGRDRAAALTDKFRAEKKLFGVSILYLFGLFGAVAADAAIGRPAFWPVLF